MKIDLTFRHASIDDSRLIYQLQIDETVRANSFNQKLFSFNQHQKWFLERIDNEKFKFLIFTNDLNSEIGLVRFQILESQWLIGVIVAPDFRGKGLSKQMIRVALEWSYDFKKMSVIAQIKKSNIASVKAFKAAGFIFDKLISEQAEQYKYEN